MSKSSKKTKKYLQIATIIALLLLGINQFSNYLDNKAKNIDFGLFNKTISIQNKFISYFYTPSGDISTYKIDISDKNYKKLTNDLPNSGREYVKAELTFPNEEKIEVELKLRGGNMWHWAHEKKSWRIKWTNDNDNNVKLNLINPRQISHIIFPLEYHLAEEAGILSPEHEFVALHINDEYQGLYSSIEQIDEIFLINHDQEPGDIFYGEPPPPYGDWQKTQTKDLMN